MHANEAHECIHKERERRHTRRDLFRDEKEEGRRAPMYG